MFSFFLDFEFDIWFKCSLSARLTIVCKLCKKCVWVYIYLF